MALVRITFEVPDTLLDAVLVEVRNHIYIHKQGAPPPQFIQFRATEYLPVDVEQIFPVPITPNGGSESHG